MQFNEDKTPALFSIRQIEPGRILINAKWYTAPFIIFPHRLVPNWPGVSLEDLRIEDFKQIENESFDILLIGTSQQTQCFPPKLYADWALKKVAVEVMNTRAACRTFLILASEGRRMGALLFP